MLLPKRKPYRNTKIIASAKGQDCTINFTGCNYDNSTVVACHLDGSYGILAGKGLGQKSDDDFVMFGCSVCHAKLALNDKPGYLLRAIIKTRRKLRELGVID